MFETKDSESLESSYVIGDQFDSKIVSTTTIHNRSSSINITLDGSNYCVWFKILKMHIVGKEKKRILYREKSCSKRR